MTFDFSRYLKGTVEEVSSDVRDLWCQGERGFFTLERFDSLQEALKFFGVTNPAHHLAVWFHRTDPSGVEGSISVMKKYVKPKYQGSIGRLIQSMDEGTCPDGLYDSGKMYISQDGYVPVEDDGFGSNFDGYRTEKGKVSFTAQAIRNRRKFGILK